MGCRYLWVSKPWSSEVSRMLAECGKVVEKHRTSKPRESLGFFRSCRYFMRKFPLQKQTKKKESLPSSSPHTSLWQGFIYEVTPVTAGSSNWCCSLQIVYFCCCVGTVEGSCLLADESHNHHHQTQSKQIIQPANTLRSPNIMFRDHLGVGAGGYR